MSCPPPSPDPCARIRPPPLATPPCFMKPVMTCMHWYQTRRTIAEAMCLSIASGACYYFFIALPRKAKYKDFYARGEFEDWADEMSRKGLFQSVPKEYLKDNQHMKKK